MAHYCERAAAAGVRAGMTLAHARALLIGVSIHEQPSAPEEDRASLRRLGRWMLRFSPSVAMDADGLVLDISGCQRLFGGERRHVQKIDAALRAFRLDPRLAAAPTYACARAVARFGGEKIAHIAARDIVSALSPLPLEALGLDGKTMNALTDVGIERIEHLLTIPRDELAARFGQDLLSRIDRATGNGVEAVDLIPRERRWEASRVFDGPVKRMEIIEMAAEQLLIELVSDLQAQDRGTLVLVVELRRVDTHPVEVSITLTRPSRDASHLWALLRPKLERAHLGFGVEEIILRAPRTDFVSCSQSTFLRDDARGFSDPTALGELLDRLIDRLGPAAVNRVELSETYIPEMAFVQTSAQRNDPPAPTSAKTAKRATEPRSYPAERPSQLFANPEPVRVLSLVPDGPPVWLDWRGQSGAILATNGPERIAFPWWTPHSEGSRDYFETEDEHGRRLWIYQEGASGRWFVHGQWI